jgi:hypothetical protein
MGPDFAQYFEGVVGEAFYLQLGSFLQQYFMIGK